MREKLSPFTEILIRNARSHNLKIEEIRFPNQGITAVSGPSGSGKSTLIFDIIHREAQYRTLRALHSGVKPIESLPAPANAEIDYLPPISAMRHDSHQNWRKGTQLGDICHITPLLRSLFVQHGHLRCPTSQQELIAYTPATLAEKLIRDHGESRIHCLAPMSVNENYKILISELKRQGYARLAIGSKIIMIEEAPPKPPRKWSLVIDRLKLQQRHLERLELAIKYAFSASNHRFIALINDIEYHFFERPYSEAEDRFFDLPNPNSLNPAFDHSSCLACDGIGYSSDKHCTHCAGTGLNQLAGMLCIGDVSFQDILSQPIEKAQELLASPSHSRTASQIHSYLAPLQRLGLGALPLKHPANWLSSGERSRARISALFNSAMPGSTLLIDEPSLGLDNDSLDLLTPFLSEQAHSHPMIIIDHHPKIWKIAHLRYELGPGAGRNGGRLIQPSTPPKSLIPFSHPSGSCEIPLFKTSLPLQKGHLNVLCGASGSGKTRVLKQIQTQAQTHFTHMHNLNELSQINNSRSCVATLTGIWDPIRTLLTQTIEAKTQGLTAGQFSFNTVGGRCEDCKGLGIIHQSIVGLPTFDQICASCNGQRFEANIRRVRYRNLNVSGILSLTIEHALPIFSAHPDLYPILTALNEIGLGHLILGQASQSLSGGETRRVHIAKTLARAYKKGIALSEHLFLIDEPTAALHPKDASTLLGSIAALCERGATFLCASHEPLFLHHAAQCIDIKTLWGTKLEFD